jgi:hypothetical protein
MPFRFIVFIITLLPVGALASTSGNLSLQLSAMPELDAPTVASERAALYLNLDHQTKWRRIWGFNFSPYIISDPLNESTPEQFHFEAKELSFDYKKSSTRLKLGISTVNWEGTDFLNPMDIVSPKIYFDPLNSEKRGSAGLFYSDKVASVGFDFVYIPVQSHAKLPGDNSPWWPRDVNLPTQNNDVELLLPENPEYKVLGRETLNQADEHNVALRLQYQGDSFDLSIAGFIGASQTPILQPIVTGTLIDAGPPKRVIQINSLIEVQPIYYKVSTGAFALTKTFDSFILRLSAHHIQPLGRDTRLPSWSELGVLSIEKNINLRKSTLTLLAQMISSREAESDSLSLLSSLTKRSAGLGFRWPFAEKWTWISAAFHETVTESSYIHSDLAWSFADGFSQGLAVDVFTGKDISTLGAYDKNDRIILKTNYLF